MSKKQIRFVDELDYEESAKPVKLTIEVEDEDYSDGRRAVVRAESEDGTDDLLTIREDGTVELHYIGISSVLPVGKNGKLKVQR